MYEKFFINYGEDGGEGKGFMNCCFAGMYPKMSFIGARQEEIENDQFNGWVSENLLVWMEEAESGKVNYLDKKIHTRIKQLTTMQTSKRKMYAENESARNWAIVGMNSNDPTLYGLIRGDNALKERLVILKFNSPWSDKKALMNFHHSFTDNPNFAYSLYHYLKFDHVIPEEFIPARYYGNDKWKIIDEMKMANKNAVEIYLKNKMRDIFYPKKMRSTDERIMAVIVENLSQSYNDYVKERDLKFAPPKVNETMKQLGFRERNMKINNKQHTHWWIGRDKFEEVYKKLNGENDDYIEIIDDDEDEVYQQNGW